MKISVNGVDLLTLSDLQKQVLSNDIPSNELEADLGRRIQWVLLHKYECCFKRMKDEWDSKLAANGVSMIPTGAEEYAALVFAQPNYKDRLARDLEQSQNQ